MKKSLRCLFGLHQNKMDISYKFKNSKYITEYTKRCLYCDKRVIKQKTENIGYGFNN